MGAANVIPGVSGGTIALITGIFERLINALKSFDLTAIKLFFTGKFNAFAKHVDLSFLCALFFGIAIAILSLAKLLKYLFEFYPIFIWAFFFGLVVASDGFDDFFGEAPLVEEVGSDFAVVQIEDGLFGLGACATFGLNLRLDLGEFFLEVLVEDDDANVVQEACDEGFVVH